MRSVRRAQCNVRRTRCNKCLVRYVQRTQCKRMFDYFRSGRLALIIAFWILDSCLTAYNLECVFRSFGFMLLMKHGTGCLSEVSF